jgi:hypothetical protein
VIAQLTLELALAADLTAQTPPCQPGTPQGASRPGACQLMRGAAVESGLLRVQPTESTVKIESAITGMTTGLATSAAPKATTKKPKSKPKATPARVKPATVLQPVPTYQAATPTTPLCRTITFKVD